MADIKKTIEIIFAGTDNVTSVFSGLPEVIGKSVIGVGTALAGIGMAAAVAANNFEEEQERMRAALGLTAEKAEAAGKIARDIYSGSALTEGITDATDAVIYAYQLMGEAADAEVQGMTEKALLLAKTYNQDVNKSMDAAKTLMDTLGLSSEQAFDFLALGFQKGLDRSGDFLETVSEYSVQFGDASADAGQFFSLIQSGIQGGILGTDKGADAFKTFAGLIREQTDDVQTALNKLGINPEKFKTLPIIEQFDTVIRKIGDTKDPMEQYKLGVALLGLPWEDLGVKAGTAIDITATKLADMTGAMGKLDSDGITDQIVSIWRTILTGVAEAPIWDQFLGTVSEKLRDIKDVLPELDYSEFLKNIEILGKDIGAAFAKIFGKENLDTGDIKEILQSVTDALSLIVSGADKVITIIGDVGGAIGKISGAIGLFSSQGLDIFDSVKNLNKDIGLSEFAFEHARLKAQEMFDTINKSEAVIKTNAADVKPEIETLASDFDNLIKDKNVEISLKGGKAKDDLNMIIKTLEDGSVVMTQIDIDKNSIDKTKEIIKKEIPPEKELEILTNLKIEELKAETDKIRIEGENLQTAMEWKAQLDIANVEANAEITKGIIDGLSTTVDSTGSVIQSLAGDIINANKETQNFSDDTSNSFKEQAQEAETAKGKFEAMAEEIGSFLKEEKMLRLNVSDLDIAKSKFDTLRETASDFSFNDFTEEAAEAYQEMYDAGANYIGKLLKEWDELDKNIQDINDRIYDISEDTQDKIMGIKRKGYDEDERRLYAFQEYYDNYAKAVESARKGETGTAEKFYNDAISVAESIANRLEDWGKMDQKAIDLIRTSEEEIRDIKRKNYSEEELHLDKLKEYYEKYDEAVRLTKEGDYERAEAFFNDARTVAKEIADGVKIWGDTDALAISLIQDVSATEAQMIRDQQQSLKGTGDIAIGLINDASSAETDMLLSQQDIFKKRQISIQDELDTTEKVLSVLTDFLGSSLNRLDETIQRIPKKIEIKSPFEDMSISDYLLIRNIMEDENRRREEALDLHREVTEAQIRVMDAQSAALERGDSVITIQADGMEPEIEAFMWRILSRIQMRVNESIGSFFLGVNPWAV